MQAVIKTFNIQTSPQADAPAARLAISAAISKGEVSLSVTGGDKGSSIDERMLVQPSSPVSNVQNTAAEVARVYGLGKASGTTVLLAVTIANTSSIDGATFAIDVSGGTATLTSLYTDSDSAAGGGPLKVGESRSYQVLVVLT